MLEKRLGVLVPTQAPTIVPAEEELVFGKLAAMPSRNLR